MWHLMALYFCNLKKVGLGSLADNCPWTIFRCPWNTRTILEFCGQFSEKKLNFKFWRTISEFGGQFQNLADNLRIWPTIFDFGGQFMFGQLCR